MKNDEFEWLAQEFRRETGLMAPGKDRAPAEGEQSIEGPALMNKWRSWLASRRPPIAVAGRRLTISIAEFQIRGEAIIRREQEKALPDSAIINFCCDAIRLTREYVDLLGVPIAERAQGESPCFDPQSNSVYRSGLGEEDDEREWPCSDCGWVAHSDADGVTAGCPECGALMTQQSAVKP